MAESSTPAGPRKTRAHPSGRHLKPITSPDPRADKEHVSCWRCCRSRNLRHASRFWLGGTHSGDLGLGASESASPDYCCYPMGGTFDRFVVIELFSRCRS